MAVVCPNLEDAPSFDGMAVRDAVDLFAIRSPSEGTGVISGMAVTQDTGSDMKVAVATGVVAVAGIQYTYTGTGSPFTIAAASTSDRRDTIVYTVGTGVQVIQGGPCGYTSGNWSHTVTTNNPPAKQYIVGSNAVPANSVILAEVYVATTTTVIVTATNVVDKRFIVGADVLGGVLQGSANVESIIRGQTLAAPAIFTSSGTWTPSTTGQAIFAALVVGDGGAGKTGGTTVPGGGGGGGEVLPFFYLGNVTSPQTVTIGPGGMSSAGAGSGTSIGSLVTAAGGAGGGTAAGGAGGDDSPGGTSTPNPNAAGMGSGGGGVAASTKGGIGGPGYGRFGSGGGGGGGVNTAGGLGGGNGGGNGGAGVTSAGGGGGGGLGGAGGAGVSTTGGKGGNAPANFGGGGGGGGAGATPGSFGNGGSGYVVIYQIA